MKMYLIRSRQDPRLRTLLQADIHWQLLFSKEEDRETNFGHALILQEAIQRETRKLEWEKQQLEMLSKDK